MVCGGHAHVKLFQHFTAKLWADINMITCLFYFHSGSEHVWMFRRVDLGMTLARIGVLCATQGIKLDHRRNERAQRQGWKYESMHINILLVLKK